MTTTILPCNGKLILFGDGGRIYIQRQDDFNLSNLPNYLEGDLIITQNQKSENTTFSSLRRNQNHVHDVLSNLIGIHGSLYITGTDYHELTGFAKLEYITGDLIIHENPTLRVIPTFPSLRHVRSIVITTNACTKIIGFENLITMTTLKIASNPELEMICGFIKLSQMQNFVVVDNARLADITGFCQLTLIDNELVLQNLTARLTVQAFQQLIRVDTLAVSNTGCLGLDLPQLIAVGNMYYYLNYGLNYIRMPRLAMIGELLVIDCAELTELITSATFHARCIRLRNIGITRTLFLEGVVAISKYLCIESNSQLEQITGLTNLTFLGQSSPRAILATSPRVVFEMDSVFQSATPHFHENLIPSIIDKIYSEYPVPDAALTIRENQALVTIDIRSPITTTSAVSIRANPKLTKATLFPKLQFVLSVEFIDNPALKAVIGFMDLQSAQIIVLESVPELELFNALKSLTKVCCLKLESLHHDSIIGVSNIRSSGQAELTYHEKPPLL